MVLTYSEDEKVLDIKHIVSDAQVYVLPLRIREFVNNNNTFPSFVTATTDGF